MKGPAFCLLLTCRFCRLLGSGERLVPGAPLAVNSQAHVEASSKPAHFGPTSRGCCLLLQQEHHTDFFPRKPGRFLRLIGKLGKVFNCAISVRLHVPLLANKVDQVTSRAVVRVITLNQVAPYQGLEVWLRVRYLCDLC